MLKVSLNPSIVMKGLQELNKTKGSGNIGDDIENVFKAEDALVDNLVASKDEIALPDNRAVIKESIELMKSEIKKELGGLTGQNLPKTVSEFNNKAMQAITAGMLAGNVKTALALIPEAKPTSEPPVPVKTSSLEAGKTKNNNIEDKIDDTFVTYALRNGERAYGNNNIEDKIDDAFVTADMLADFAAQKRESLADPSYRQEAIDELNALKKLITTGLSTVTEKTLPKTTNEVIGIFIAAFTFGSLAGVTKTALALIPVKSIEPNPGTGLPGDGGGPAICPKPELPEPVTAHK